MTLRLLVFACALACKAPAAESGISGSVLGFLYDPAHGLQPIFGNPGASTIGAPLEYAGGLSVLAISPQQDYALVLSGADTLTIVLDSPFSTRGPGISIPADALLAVSPSGSAAAFYDRERSRIQVITGLPYSPALSREFDISTYPAPTAGLAVSDRGTVLAGFAENLLALGSDGSLKSLAAPRRATAARFLPRSGDAVVADSGSNAVYLVRDVPGAAEATLLAGEAEGVVGPIAVAASNDGKRVFAVSARSRTVLAVDLTSGAVTTTPCPCEPSGLAGLTGNAVFRLTEPSGGPIWVFDGDNPEQRVVFIPPYRPAEDSQR